MISIGGKLFLGRSPKQPTPGVCADIMTSQRVWIGDRFSGAGFGYDERGESLLLERFSWSPGLSGRGRCERASGRESIARVIT